MKKIVIIFFIFIHFSKTHSQSSNESKLLILNSGINGLIGGVGSIINKHNNQSVGNAFIKGFYKGAIGGTVIYGSKYLLSTFTKNQNYMTIWGSKIMFFAGNSIVENAAANRDIFEQFHLNIGFNRIDFYTKEKLKIKYHILPYSLAHFIYLSFNFKIDWKQSYKTGTFSFYGSTKKYNALGFALLNHIVISDRLIKYNKISFYRNRLNHILVHEIIHTYQIESFSPINEYFTKWKRKLKNCRLLNNFSKYFYTDFNYSFLLNKKIKESEAYYYENKFVPFR